MTGYYIFCCFIYCSCAIFVNAFGIASPELQTFLGTSETQQGLIVTFQSIGGMASAIFLALFGDRFRKEKTITVGTLALLLASLGTATLAWFFRGSDSMKNAYYVLFFFLTIGGLGNSTIDLTMNSLVSELYRNSKGTHISIIHVFYGVGAMLVAFLFMTPIRLWNGAPGFSTGYALISLGCFLCLVGYLLARRRIKSEIQTILLIKPQKLPWEVFKSGRAWVLMVIGFSYTAFQYGLTSWLSAYNMEHIALSSRISGYLISAYFLLTLCMRLLCPKIMAWLGTVRYFTIFGFLASVSLLAAFCMNDTVPYAILLLLGGFLQGGLVPCFMVIASDAFPERQSSAASFFLIAFNLAGLLIPVLMGAIIEHISFQAAMIFISMCLFVSTQILLFSHKYINFTSMGGISDESTTGQ